MYPERFEIMIPKIKVLIYCIIGFIFGAVSMAWLSRYGSFVWSYEQLSRSRETVMNSAYQSYKNGDVRTAAVLASGANGIAAIRDQQWSILYPITASLLRFSGAFDRLRVGNNYNTYIIAYLYYSSGNSGRAQIYYDRLAKNGISKDEANKAAKLILDTMSKNKASEGLKKQH